MDNSYAPTARLLLTAAPDVFANDIFAMKGGTAINLFIQDMPRLSVDIDAVYLPWSTPRDEALQAIADELDAIARRLEKLDLSSRKIASQGRGDTKLIVEDAENSGEDRGQCRVSRGGPAARTSSPLRQHCRDVQRRTRAADPRAR